MLLAGVRSAAAALQDSARAQQERLQLLQRLQEQMAAYAAGSQADLLPNLAADMAAWSAQLSGELAPPGQQCSGDAWASKHASHAWSCARGSGLTHVNASIPPRAKLAACTVGAAGLRKSRERTRMPSSQYHAPRKTCACLAFSLPGAAGDLGLPLLGQPHTHSQAHGGVAASAPRLAGWSDHFQLTASVNAGAQAHVS